MPKKTMTFEQFMHAINSHHAMNGNHSKSVKKRGSIAKGDYQTGLFGGGQSPAAQAAVQAAAQKAAQRAAEQAQRRADAQANQRAAQARASQPTAQPATRPAANGAAQAVAAQATRPVYSAPAGNGAAAAAQLGATTDPEARRKARLQREALAQRQAAQRAAAAQAMTSPTAQPTAQPNTFSSLLNSAGNALVSAFSPRRAHAAPPGPIGTVIPVGPTAQPTAQPTQTAQPTNLVQPTAQPTEAPWTAVPTQAPVYTQTPVPIVATSAPATATNSPIPTATALYGATNPAQIEASNLAQIAGQWDISKIPDRIRRLFGFYGNPAEAPVFSANAPEANPIKLKANDWEATPVSSIPGPTPTYGPLTTNEEAIAVMTAIENARKTFTNPNQQFGGIGDQWYKDVADAQPGSVQSMQEIGRPAWNSSGGQLNSPALFGAAGAVDAQLKSAQLKQTEIAGVRPTIVRAIQDAMPSANAGDPTELLRQLNIYGDWLRQKQITDNQAAKLTSAANTISGVQANLRNETINPQFKREGYNKLYPTPYPIPDDNEEVPTVSIPTPEGSYSGGNGGGVVRSGNGNTTVTQSTPTATATNTPIAISQQEMDRLRRLGALTPEAEMGNRYIVGAGRNPTDSYGLAPYQQGQPGAFNPYDVGSVPPNYVQNRVMGNIVPASYRSPTPSPSPTATTQRTQTPTPSNQARTTPTQGMPSGMITPSRTRTPTQQAMPTQTQTVIPQQAPPSGANAAPAFGQGLGVGGGAGAMIGQSPLVRAIQQLIGNQQTAQQQAISAYPQFATTQKRQKGKLKKDIGVGTGLTAHATQPVAESPMPRVHTSYGNYKFKKPSQENRSAKYGESQQLQQPVRKQIDAMQPMQPRQTMTNPMQYPPSRAPQNVLNPMLLDSNESMMFKKYMGSPAEQPVQSTDKYIPSHMQRNKQR
jgi:hypothetical protein